MPGTLDSSRNITLASALCALAGYGIGYLHLGGLFVSFMSGNSTRMGVSLAALAYRWINLAAIWFAAATALTLTAPVAATVHR